MQVVDAATLKPVGYLADISTTGLRLDSEKPVPVNANYTLRVDLAPEMANKSFLVLNGRSKWCAMDKLAPNSYNVGFEVGALSRDDSMIFQRMFENYATESRW
jgi:hypothetical protein